MNNKELIAKLNKLRTITPDSDWKSSNRELLLSQISNSGAHELSAWEIFVINLGSFAQAITKPVYALGVFALLLVSGSLFSHQIFGDAKPNDSLYIARIISEKAKLNTVLNSDARNKLAVQFATEHAKEISAVLSNPEFNNDANQDQVAKLNASFNQEIDNVKSHISYLSAKTENKEGNEGKIELLPATGTDIVTIASELKGSEGIQLFNKNVDTLPALSTTSVISTEDTASSTEVTTDSLNADSVLEEAQKLFDNKNYDEAANKLDEVGEMIK